MTVFADCGLRLWTRRGCPQIDARPGFRGLQSLHDAELTYLTDDAVVEFGRQLERTRRLLPSVDHAFVLEVERRGLPAAHHVRSVGQFLRALLRLDPGEAAGRVRAAEAAGIRRPLPVKR